MNLLGKIKQDYEYFPIYRELLEKMIQWNEDLVLFIYNNKINKDEIENIIIFFNKLFELLMNLLHNTPNNSFFEVFLNFFIVFFNKFLKMNKDIRTLLSKHFSHYFIKIYSVLIDKKIEFIDKLRDSKICLKIIKLIYKIVQSVYFHTDDLKIFDLFNYLLVLQNNIFTQSSDVFLDKVFSTIYKICKFTFKNNQEDVIKISDVLLNKIIEISKYKDDLRNTLDVFEQTFYVNMLLLSLRLLKEILKNHIINDYINDKICRVMIELSFWDNSSILDLTCKILTQLWRKSYTSKNVRLRSDFEKIFDFMFIRRYRTYYLNLSSDSPDQNIKLSVLEVLTEYLNKLIEKDDFLLIGYFNYDLSKLRLNLINDLFSSLQKYFNLSLPKYTFLKKLITLTYTISFDRIYQSIDNSTELDDEFIKKHQFYTDTWLDIIKQVNSASFKKLIKKLNEVFSVDDITKTDIAKTIAHMSRYSYPIDINVLYDTIGNCHDFSKKILEEYTNLFDFRGMDIVKAYRLFVSTFKLGGESANIYNIIAVFSTVYYEHNKDNFFNNDSEVCTLAYSILMLNTDLHDPKLIEKMTCEQYLKSLNNTKMFDHISPEFFKNIYKSIQFMPLKAANERLYDYSKNDELFENLKSRRNLCQNVSSVIESINTIHLIDYPLINSIEYLYFPKSDIKLIKTIYFLIWEDLFYNFMAIPYKFYETKDINIQSVLEKVCSISQKFDQKGNIDKLIV